MKLLNAYWEIPGDSGVYITHMEWGDTIGAAIQASGIRRKQELTYATCCTI